MSLFGRKEKREIEELRAQMSPEQVQTADYTLKLQELSAQIDEAQKTLFDIQQDCSKARTTLQDLKQQIIETDENILLQEFGFYIPHYSYSLSDEYKVKLKEVRDRQKQMIKDGKAVTGNMNWTVNGSNSKGKKMVKDTQKLLLRAFNAECDDAIEHVRFNNVEASAKKISSSAEAISKLGGMMGISIAITYLRLKTEELYLMHEYQMKKQEEKEAAKEARARQREEAKAAKELEEARKKLEKEQAHYQNALSKLLTQISTASPSKLESLNTKREELEAQLSKIDMEIKDVDYREANQRAGYVYIISNIGSFGENIYKIGMTRRLDPMDRVNELGDASVPFNFDVHAMIFTEDAPALEAALHNAFADRKVNCINQRREFFNVSLDEIKQVIRQNFDKTVEFVDIAPAEQYRESLLVKDRHAL